MKLTQDKSARLMPGMLTTSGRRIVDVGPRNGDPTDLAVSHVGQFGGFTITRMAEFQRENPCLDLGDAATLGCLRTKGLEP